MNNEGMNFILSNRESLTSRHSLIKFTKEQQVVIFTVGFYLQDIKRSCITQILLKSQLIIIFFHIISHVI